MANIIETRGNMIFGVAYFFGILFTYYLVKYLDGRYGIYDPNRSFWENKRNFHSEFGSVPIVPALLWPLYLIVLLFYSIGEWLYNLGQKQRNK